MTKRKRTNNDQHNTTSIQKTTDQPTQTRIIWFYKIVHHLVAICIYWCILMSTGFTPRFYLWALVAICIYWFVLMSTEFTPRYYLWALVAICIYWCVLVSTAFTPRFYLCALVAICIHWCVLLQIATRAHK
jgi:hypothetical protein